ncbi:GtrA family protein [Patescibacteria group bacterium]|nr:GtrA family protein [Patescibacteria group bacterium]
MTERSYSGDFFKEMEDANLRSARTVVPQVLKYLKPESVLDIGCGQGLWLRAFMEKDISDVVGYDGEYVEREKLSIPKEKFIAADLEKPLSLNRNFDLAISLEVGEHLSDAASRTFVKNLTDAAPVILFSAAIPGQGGVHHINEQWPDYWEARFKEQGYVPVDCLRKFFWGDARVAFFYAQNIMFYVKESELPNYSELYEAYNAGHNRALSLVHPQLYVRYEAPWNLIIPVLGMFPPSVIHFGKRMLPRLARLPLAQLARYIISGATAAAVYFGVLFALVQFGGVHYLAASSVALAIAIVVSFSLHKFFTFRQHALSQTHVQFVLYMIVVGIDFLINLSILWCSVELIHMPYLLGALIATVAVAVVNFFLYRSVVFRRSAKISR